VTNLYGPWLDKGVPAGELLCQGLHDDTRGLRIEIEGPKGRHGLHRCDRAQPTRGLPR
jgi:hypothetical protein